MRVWAGATVMLSPVCTPMGSKFSMEQMITTLSLKSRITSSSNSFQPITDSSSMTLGDHAGVQALGGQVLQLFQVVGDAAAGAAQGEAGPDDEGVTDLSALAQASLHGADDAALGHPEADPGHGVPEELPVFGLLDDVGVGPDHLHAVFLQHAGLRHCDGAVEAGLPAQGGKQGVGPLPLDDLATISGVMGSM